MSGTLEQKKGRLDLAVRGSQFEVVNTREFQMQVDPDFTVAMTRDFMQVQGQIGIPKANLSPPSGGAGRVNASDDVVITGQAAKDQAGPADLSVTLRVILGEDVLVDAGGFNGRIKGNLLVEQKSGLAPRGTGTVEVATGEYMVYGQKLQVDRGRVLFGGGPVDNPGLDLRVVRNIRDIVAGAQVKGTLKNPELQLFSQPMMTDADILSYIVLGRPASGSWGPTLHLGGYLSPDLYISYGIGLFNAVNTFNLRYRLTDRLNFESYTGVHNSADIVYTLEY
jgi:translocation and assembly module TamB